MAYVSRIKAGELRHRVDIVSPIGTTDSTGGVQSTDWQVVAQVWAKIEGVTGKDQFAASQFVSTVTHKITIRYQTGGPAINASNQVWFNGRTFEIQAVLNPDERTKTLILLCVEINDSSSQPPTSVNTSTIVS